MACLLALRGHGTSRRSRASTTLASRIDRSLANGASAMARSLLTSLAIIGMTLTASLTLAGDGAPAYTNGANAGYYADSGSGGGWSGFWHRCGVDFYRNNTWPEPFVTADKMAVRTPYCIMTDNGWKMQNTIGTFLFDNDTQQVNQAGELLVKWIVTQAPIHRRAVFVLRGDNPNATNVRVQSVQAAVAKYANGCVCPVLLTDSEPAGWSASYIDTITQQYGATIPAPRLPSRQGSGGSGGGGGSGASTGGASTSTGGTQ